MVRKYVNPRLAPCTDESETLRDLGVFGAESRHVVAELTGVHATALALLPPYSHVTVSVDGARVLVAHVPDLDVDGYELFAPPGIFGALWDRAVAAKAIPAGLEAWEIARVEAGRPEYGIDMDDTTIPQEANMDDLHALSYTKGCYVGQEIVARVHFRGHVNRHLRGLRLASGDTPPAHAPLLDADGRPVGEVRSAVISPRLGAIALGMVRREVAAGAALTARGEQGEWRLDVCPLPFAG
jgi:folate-binding protein YgfZ